MACNRVRQLGGWPDDHAQRRALARLDLAFCKALGRILFPGQPGVIPKELCRTWRAARQRLRAGQ